MVGFGASNAGPRYPRVLAPRGIERVSSLRFGLQVNRPTTECFHVLEGAPCGVGAATLQPYAPRAATPRMQAATPCMQAATPCIEAATRCAQVSSS